MITPAVSKVIGAPLERVWAVVSDFNGLPKWHPAAVDSFIEGDLRKQTVGCIRNFGLSDGSGRVRETLLAFSDVDKSITYDMLPGGPLDFADYISSMKFISVDAQPKTVAIWSASLGVPSGEEEKWLEFLEEEVFLNGLEALEQRVIGSR